MRIDTSFADNLPKGESSFLNFSALSSIEEDKPPSIIGTMVIAVFPGFFLHGLGHFYIGDHFTASILLGVETIAWSFMFIGLACWDSNITCLIGELGGLMFITSWLYDVIAAPIKASNMRKEYEQKKKKEKENILKPDIGLRPLMEETLESPMGELSFQSSHYKAQNTMGDMTGGMILLTWRW